MHIVNKEEKYIHSLHYIQNESNSKLLMIRNFLDIKAITLSSQKFDFLCESNKKEMRFKARVERHRKTPTVNTYKDLVSCVATRLCAAFFPITHTSAHSFETVISIGKTKNCYQKHFAINHLSLSLSISTLLTLLFCYFDLRHWWVEIISSENHLTLCSPHCLSYQIFSVLYFMFYFCVSLVFAKRFSRYNVLVNDLRSASDHLTSC